MSFILRCLNGQKDSQRSFKERLTAIGIGWCFRGGGLVPTLCMESRLSEVAEWLQR